MPADPRDPEIRAFVRSARGQTYTAIAAELAARFGAERAWPPAMIATERRNMRPPHCRTVDHYSGDPEIMAFIADRADLTPVLDIVRQGKERFATFPSKSSVQRLIQHIRRESPAGGFGAQKAP